MPRIDYLVFEWRIICLAGKYSVCVLKGALSSIAEFFIQEVLLELSRNFFVTRQIQTVSFSQLLTRHPGESR